MAYTIVYTILVLSLLYLRACREAGDSIDNTGYITPPSTVEVSTSSDVSMVDANVTDTSTTKPEVTEPSVVIPDYFTNMGSSFVSMVDSIEDGIPSKPFLACAAEMANIFGKRKPIFCIVRVSMFYP